MKFAIITHAEHKIDKQAIVAYEPYVREMNLWLKYVDEVKIVAPFSSEKVSAVDSAYNCKKQNTNQLENWLNDAMQLLKIPSFDITSIQNSVKAIVKIPKICYTIFKAMQWADHIHLRCPGNIGLLGAVLQIAFPKKPKTVKYAGNWDPNSKQPLSYRFQKWIVSNTFLTKNCKVLVYGTWPNQTKNIVPFFTATYAENEFDAVEISTVSVLKEQMLKQVQQDGLERHPQLDWGSKDLDKDKQIPNQVGNDGTLKFIYVGGLTPGKRPLLSVQHIHQLKLKGYNVQMDMYGDGAEKEKIVNYILDNALENTIILHGNASKETVKKAYWQSHFLLFLSQSEGWPKVVAEAMSWGCVPLTTAVSCVPYMLGNETRGKLVQPVNESITDAVVFYINHPEVYKQHAQAGMQWARQFTLEYFEAEIKKLIASED